MWALQGTCAHAGTGGLGVLCRAPGIAHLQSCDCSLKGSSELTQPQSGQAGGRRVPGPTVQEGVFTQQRAQGLAASCPQWPWGGQGTTRGCPRSGGGAEADLGVLGGVAGSGAPAQC